MPIPNKKLKEHLHNQLSPRDGKRRCHYCGIQEEDFLGVWGQFYGLPYRGQRLEIDHKHAVVAEGKRIRKPVVEHTPENCVLACALCNMAKSNMFTYEEFKKVGRVIEEIWRARKAAGIKVP